tara:strand:- start:2993 stop:3925 length:933 start_codon:yes stop_codon:yes gene_type:complete
MKIEIELGEKKVTNIDLNKKFPNWNFKRFEKRVGIKNRYVTKDTSLDLSLKAFNKISIGKNINDIKNIIYTTQTPKYIIPGDGYVFLDKISDNYLECPNLYQLSNGCSGFVDALGLMQNLNIKSNTLIINSDTYNKIIHGKDRMNKSIFSDCASVAFLSSYKISDYKTISIPNKWKNISCHREQINNIEIEYSKGSFNNKSTFWMDGPEVYNFAINDVFTIVQNRLRNNNSIQPEIIIFHQANKMMLDIFKQNLKKRNIYVPIVIDNGNLVGCSIPNVLKENIISFRKKNILLVGFGVGLKVSLINFYYE